MHKIISLVGGGGVLWGVYNGGVSGGFGYCVIRQTLGTYYFWGLFLIESGGKGVM